MNVRVKSSQLNAANSCTKMTESMKGTWILEAFDPLDKDAVKATKQIVWTEDEGLGDYAHYEVINKWADEPWYHDKIRFQMHRVT